MGRKALETDLETADWASQLAGVQRELVGAHLLLAARLLRRSAAQDYDGYEPRNLIDRRIVFTLYRIEQGRVSELAALLGNDIAQVSRALSAMKKLGLIDRERQRDPYVLTPEGHRLGALMDQVALRREHDLAIGLEPLQLFELAGMLDNLTNKALVLLSEELAHARDENAEHEDVIRPEIPSRVQPTILALSTTIMRSATLAFKRQTGLSQYEWRILANLAYRPRTTFMDLVNHIGSDKAQVSRAINPMIDAHMLSRTKAARGQPATLEITEAGWALHQVMQQDAKRRNEFLLEDFTASQKERLLVYLQLLIENANQMIHAAE